MFAIAILFVLGAYLCLSLYLASVASKQAEKRGIKWWKWGLPTFLFMMGLVFWDWVPTEVTYAYHCNENAGYRQYKTVEQWKMENPGVWETLDRNKLPEEYLVKVKSGSKKSSSRYYALPDGTELVALYDNGGKYMYTKIVSNDGIRRSWVNQRFIYEVERDGSFLFYVRKFEERIVDSQTGKAIAVYIDYTTNISSMSLGANSLKDYKFWLKKDTCDEYQNERKIFSEFLHLITYKEKIQL